MNDAQTNSDSLTVPRIIWLAMVIAVILYGAFVLVLPGKKSEPGGDLVPIFALVAGMLAACSFVVRTVLTRALNGDAARGANMVPYVVAFALAEAIAIFGLVLHLLGEPQLVSLGFVVAGLVVLTLHFPIRHGGGARSSLPA